MKIVRGLVVAGLSAAWVLAGSPVSAESRSKKDPSDSVATGFYRDVDSYGQEQSRWCWATTLQMIFAASPLKKDLVQCALASDSLLAEKPAAPAVDCCALKQACSAEPPQLDACEEFEKCNITDWPTRLESELEFNDTYATETKRDRCPDKNGEDCPLKWYRLKKALQKAPVAFSWQYGENRGHIMVATSYVEVGRTKWVLIHDPWPPGTGDVMLVSYKYYKEGPRGKHWIDYYKMTGNPWPFAKGTPNQGEF